VRWAAEGVCEFSDNNLKVHNWSFCSGENCAGSGGVKVC
jgi:hypothetical protein